MIKMTCQSLAPVTLLKKETPTQVFSCELCEIFKNNFLQNTSGECFWHLYHHSPYRIYFLKKKWLLFWQIEKISSEKDPSVTLTANNIIIYYRRIISWYPRKKSHQSQNIAINTLTTDESDDEENSTDELLALTF